MKALRYHAPDSAAAASALLVDHDAAAVLGGGTMLLPALRRGERVHPHVVDLRRAGLSDVFTTSAAIAQVGAMATYSDIVRSGALTGRASLLTVVSRGITGGAQLRNQGTVGGSACHANPASDMPACLVGLGARVMIHGPAGDRELPAAAFFLDAFRTALNPGELLTGFRIPTDTARVGYYKLKLSEGSWPIATATAVLPSAPHPSQVKGAVPGPQAPTVTLGGIASHPVTVDLSEMLSDTGEIDASGAFDALIREAAGEPWADELAPGSYRLRVAPIVARRAIQQAIGAS